MKRQRNTKVVAAAAADKNAKGGAKVEGSHEEHDIIKTTTRKAAAGKEVEAAEEETLTAAEAVVERLAGEEEWPWMRGEVDEQMSWGYISPPHWDLEELKGKARSEVYSDDNWDDDIWGLKAIKEIPNDDK